MKRTHDTTRILTFIVQAGLITALAAVLLIPTTLKVSGAETKPQHEPGRQLPKPPASDRLLQPSAPQPFVPEPASQQLSADNPPVFDVAPAGRLELPVNAYRG